MTATADLRASGIVDAYPLAAMQAGMVFHNAFEPDTATYHDVFTLTLRAAYDERAMRAAVDQVVARHAVLRTSFNVGDFSQPVQLVHAAVTVPYTEVDLTGLDAEEAQRRVWAWRDEEKRRPFDLAEPPLLRVVVHRRPDGIFSLGLSFHHAILDGWSVASMITELLRRYAGELRGDPQPADPPVVTFRDFVAAERAAIASSESAEHWRRVVADAPAGRIPRLPSWPVGDGEDAANSPVRVDPRLVAGLDRVARELRVPPRTVLLACHLRVMGLVGGEVDVTTGIVTHGRSEAEGGEETYGMFLNTLPVRAGVAAASWAELIRGVFDAEVASLPHRRYPLAEIGRVTGQPPPFETLFDYRDFHVYSGLSRSGIEIVDYDYFDQTNIPFAAGFIRSDAEGGSTLLLVYARDQFPREQIERIGELYLRAFADVVADVESDPRTTAGYLRGRDAARIAEWNDTAIAWPGGAALAPRAVADAAARHPDGPAVVAADGTFRTYAEFTRDVRRLAARLRSCGVGPDRVVGVLAERGPDLLTAVHAVWAAGGAYLPLEPDLPADRLHTQVADAGAQVVVTDWRADAAADRLPGGVETVAVGDGKDDDADLPADLPVAVPPDALAYVIFTSGSTGRPKGVGVSHRALANRLRWMADGLPVTAEDRVLHKTPFGFDVSVWELALPLMLGGTVVVAPPGAQREPAVLADLIADHRISTVHFVPSMLDAFLDFVADHADERPVGPSLRRVVASGEALPAALADRFRRVLPGVELHNLYGPTEAAIDVTWHRCADGDQLVPIGRPVANTRLEVLDPNGERVPVGTPGELHLAGVQLARGYLGRAALTAERFVPDRWGTPGDRLYRTGDQARWLPTGEVEFLGRLDGQVKLRGFRIELGEVEAALRDCPGVRQAAAAVRDGGVLVGYLVGDADDPVVLDRLRARLPDYMVPSTLVRLDELPVTANGKLDRTALPSPEGPAGRAPYAPPETETERLVAAVFAETLYAESLDTERRGEKVGRADNFFALGGDSIRSLKAAARLRRAGHRVTVQQIFAHATVAELAAYLNGVPAAADPASADPGPFGLLTAADRALLPGPEDIEDAYPLATLQAGMVFHNAYRHGSATFHDAVALTVAGRYDPAALAAALADCARRHEALRTSFDLDSCSEPVALVRRDVRIPVTEVDLTALSPDEAADRVRAWLSQESRREIRWDAAPLVTVVVHRLPGDRFAVGLGFPHALLDGWSASVLLTEMLTGQAPPAAPVPYREFVARERAVVAGGEAAAFWRDALSGAGPTRLPRRSGYPTGPDETARTLHTTLSRAEVDALTALAASRGVPLRTVVAAAHLRAVAELSGVADVTCGLVSHARSESDGGDRTLGLFLNAVPVRVDAGGTTGAGLVDRVRAAEADLLPHRQYPLAEIQRELGHCPFETVLDYRDFRAHGSVLGSDLVEQTNLPLTLNCVRSPADGGGGGGMELRLLYAAAQFPTDHVDQILRTHLSVLRALAADPAAPLPPLGAVTAGPGMSTEQPAVPPDAATGVDCELAERIAALAGDVLGRTPVDPAEDLAATGLHSLAALRLARRIRREVPGAAPDVATVLEGRTAAGIARSLRGAG